MCSLSVIVPEFSATRLLIIHIFNERTNICISVIRYNGMAVGIVAKVESHGRPVLRYANTDRQSNSWRVVDKVAYEPGP